MERDGVHIAWERYGDGEPTILLLPTWSIVHSRLWKMQIPYLARHYRVVTFDGRGNGRSDRPEDVAAYADTEFVADALAVLDATATARAIVVGVSMGGGYALRLAAEHPDRVEAAVFEGPYVPLADPDPERQTETVPFDEPLERYEGWAKYNLHYWRQDYRDFLEFFFGQVYSEPHSTKPIEDCVGWGLETDAETLIRIERAPYVDRAAARDFAARVTCPCLVIHGGDDGIIPARLGRALAEALGAEFLELAGSGHNPNARDPVRFDLALRDFIDRVHPPALATSTEAPTPAGDATVGRPAAGVAGTVRSRSWTRACGRRRRALYISSPIGLGHAQRDLAIARELRRIHPDLEIDWLAQHPVTQFLEASGERIHPASTALASESGHIESESGEHDLHCFGAWRRMDEILLANFMVFHDLVRDDPYDLWIGDEAWELDYYLHENPELKTAAYVWLTDFVGWLPMPDGGEREAYLTADYNAEMIEHIARFPRIRDRAIFVGNPDDIVPDSFGPGLPKIRGWTEAHYDFAGYVTGFD
ncbi:MAG: alpha/beta hydrolase, partial [Anaerolinea sp.]|nr:alpha/beta hydrolase [Anaerolinea sp.]